MNGIPMVGEVWLLRNGKPAHIDFKLENNYYLCTMRDERGYGNKRCYPFQEFQEKAADQNIAEFTTSRCPGG